MRYALCDWRLCKLVTGSDGPPKPKLLLMMQWHIPADVLAISYSAMNLTLGSVSGFLPTIVVRLPGCAVPAQTRALNPSPRVQKGLGYSDANAQLYTVPPYAVSLAVSELAYQRRCSRRISWSR